MASKFILILACFAGQAGAARSKALSKYDEDPHDASLLEQSQEASQETVEDIDADVWLKEKAVNVDPDLEDMKPGTPVVWTSSSSGKSYNGVVKSAKVMPMVEVAYQSSRGTKTRWMPLEDLDVQDSDEEEQDNEDDLPSSGGRYSNLNLRQKVACDVCLRKLSSCSGYVPSPGMLDPVRPPPESPNGRYYQCPPSERELWSTDDRFKVLEDGTPGKGDRSKCPSARRTAVVNGKLKHAQRTCKLAVKKSGMDCSDLVNDVAKVFGRTATCSSSVLSLYPK